jgi:ketosteroid isomerase-like protein
MRTKLPTLLWLLAMTGSAAAITLDTQVEAAIHRFIDSFNKGDTKGAEAAHVTTDLVIIDEVPPFQWQGANAFKTWLADLTKHDEAAGVTDGKVTLGAPIRQEIAGDRAYVVMDVTYSYKSRGIPVEAAAQNTFVLRKEADGWRIGGWTYSGAPAMPTKK